MIIYKVFGNFRFSITDDKFDIGGRLQPTLYLLLAPLLIYIAPRGLWESIMGAEFSLADPTPVSSINDNSITESRTDEQHAICDADCDSVEPAQRPSLYPLNNNNNNNSSNNSSNGHTPHLQYVTRFLQMKSAPSLLENQVSYIHIK